MGSFGEKINLQKAIILLNNNITSSKILDNFSIHNAKSFFLGLRFIIQNTLFLDVLRDYSNSDIISGSNISTNWLQHGKYQKMIIGSYFDGFKPNKVKSTPLVSWESTVLKMKTGRDKLENIRNIMLLNNANVYNFFSEVLNGDHYITYNIPSFNNLKIKNSSTDGYQYCPTNKEMFYLDTISARVFNFESSSNTDLNGLYCKKYDLSEHVNLANETYQNPYSEFSTLFTKSNKNLVVSGLNLFRSNSFASKFISILDEATNKTMDSYGFESYFCYDKYSNFLIKSELKFLVKET